MTRDRSAKAPAAAARRAVQVHGLDEALRAAAAADELGVPLTLFSAPDAAASMGPAWFRGIADAVARAYPALDVEAVLDCGDRAGDALAALRAGVRRIRFAGNRTAAARLRDIAEAQGARLVPRPARILDPRRADDPDAALRRWLGGR